MLHNLFSFLFPVINLEGPQLEFGRLISWMKFETKDDYEKYLSRLEAFPTQVHVQLLATNNKRTLSYHTFAMNSVFSRTQLHFIIAVGI